MKVIAWIFSWMFFWLGHICSDKWPLTKFYQWLMITSLKIQDWGKLDTPWVKVEDK